MRARIAAVVMLVGGMSAVLLIPEQSGTGSVFAAMQEKLKDVRSMKFIVWTRWGDGPKDMAHVNLLGEDLGYMKRTIDGEFTIFDRKQRKMVTVMPKQHKAVMFTNVEGENPIPNLFDMLLSASERSVQELGDREIDGKKLKGFVAEIYGARMDVWVDPTTKLPVHIEERHRITRRTGYPDPQTRETKWFEPGTEVETVFTEFVYNAELDAAQFRIEAPPGYAVEHRELPSAKEPNRTARQVGED